MKFVEERAGGVAGNNGRSTCRTRSCNKKANRGTPGGKEKCQERRKLFLTQGRRDNIYPNDPGLSKFKKKRRSTEGKNVK